MNFTDSFQDFSTNIGIKDIFLYAGIGLVVWYMFKDNLPALPASITDVWSNFNKRNNSNNVDVVDKLLKGVKIPKKSDQQLFLDLVVSWKQTRDLAEQSGCRKAVEVADQMFPYLSPQICEDKSPVVDSYARKS